MRTHRLIRAFGVGSLLLAASGCATTALLEQELVKTNTQTVLAFEETVFNKHEVQEAFRHYIGEGFIEHDPRLAGTPGRGVGNGLGPSAQAAERAYRAVIAQQGPQSRRSFGHSIGQGQLVATQSQWTRSAQSGGTLAVVDIYRLREGRIIEHWDVAEATVPAGAAEPR
jgi:predicted SnoaL-like aldol condensation-catalyzing enzyme